MSIVVLGAYTRDLFMFGSRLPSPGESVNFAEYYEAHGGKGANQAVAAARLGATTTLVTCLGDDKPGMTALEMLRGEGIDTSCISIVGEVKTGVSFILVDGNGRQLIANHIGASSHITLEDVRRAGSKLGSASVLLIQGEIDADVSLAAAALAGPGTLVVLDPSPVEAFMSISTFQGVDVLTPNIEEAKALARNPCPNARFVAEATKVPIVINTLGPEGAELFMNGSAYRIPAVPANVVDTTGAGDAFNGALAAGVDRGLDLRYAARYAAKCASFSVARKFCIPSFPSMLDVPFD